MILNTNIFFIMKSFVQHDYIHYKNTRLTFYYIPLINFKQLIIRLQFRFFYSLKQYYEIIIEYFNYWVFFIITILTIRPFKCE
jgi:hypothetical protein